MSKNISKIILYIRKLYLFLFFFLYFSPTYFLTLISQFLVLPTNTINAGLPKSSLLLFFLINLSPLIQYW